MKSEPLCQYPFKKLVFCYYLSFVCSDDVLMMSSGFSKSGSPIFIFHRSLLIHVHVDKNSEIKIDNRINIYMAILKFTSLCEAPYENIFSFKEEGSDKQIMSTISRQNNF